LQMAKCEFDALRGTYHVPVRADFVIVGKDEDNAKMYSITDRIYRVEGDTEQEMAKKGEVALGVLQYFIDKLESYSPETGDTDYFLSDIALEWQYVYGRTKENQTNEFRLVDVDPERLENTIEELLLSLQEVLNTMIRDVVSWYKSRGKSVEAFRAPVKQLLQKLETMEQRGYLERSSRLDMLRNISKSAFSDSE